MADGALATGASGGRKRQRVWGEGEAGEGRVCVCGWGGGGFRLKPDD